VRNFNISTCGMLFRELRLRNIYAASLALKSSIKNAFFSVITEYLFDKKELESVGHSATLLVAFSGRQMFRFISECQKFTVASLYHFYRIQHFVLVHLGFGWVVDWVVDTTRGGRRFGATASI
jgi:hypothetical protein